MNCKKISERCPNAWAIFIMRLIILLNRNDVEIDVDDEGQVLIVDSSGKVSELALSTELLTMILDSEGVYVNTVCNSEGTKWGWSITRINDNITGANSYDTRKEALMAAFTVAFEVIDKYYNTEGVYN